MFLRMQWSYSTALATPTFLHHMIEKMFRSREAELEKELFSACEAGDVDRVRMAIAAGVDPKKAINKDSFHEETPLHTACKYVIILVGVAVGSI